MWNNNQNNNGPPSFPSPGFPSPGTGGHPGYSPSYAPPPSAPPGGAGYAPPPGAPPSGAYPPQQGHPPAGFAPPPGAPPQSRGGGGFPGAQYRQQHQPPPGPPPQGYGGGGYGGPPPQQFQGGYGGPPPPYGGGGGGGGGGYNPSYGAPPPPPHRPPTQQQHYGPHIEGPQHQDMQPYFQYSQCTGKKKALLIGINYFNQNGELRGCINDVRNIQNFIIRHFNYRQDDIVTLTDDASNPRQRPTRENILRAMQWLVNNAQPNDSLFFHYSGHGGQTKDLDGDEADGYDEVIYPVDHESNGHIVDDDMHAIMVRPLPAGCRLTAIFDSCHSGSALDLPYIYSTEGKIKEPNLAAEAGQGLLSAVSSYARGDMGGVFKSAMGIMKTATGSTKKAEEYAKQTRTSPADVISWSGCKDVQTSADTTEAGNATGAMSYAFMSAWEQNPGQSYQQLLISLREILKSKYSQKPQLSSSHPMDTNVLFLM